MVLIKERDHSQDTEAQKRYRRIMGKYTGTIRAQINVDVDSTMIYTRALDLITKDTAKEKRKARLKELKKPRGPLKRLYTLPEAAFYLGRTVDALREMIWAGKLRVVRDGKRILLDIRDLDAWIERCKEQCTF